jgi:hypothetical protein
MLEGSSYIIAGYSLQVAFSIQTQIIMRLDVFSALDSLRLSIEVENV